MDRISWLTRPPQGWRGPRLAGAAGKRRFSGSSGESGSTRRARAWISWVTSLGCDACSPASSAWRRGTQVCLGRVSNASGPVHLRRPHEVRAQNRAGGLARKGHGFERLLAGSGPNDEPSLLRNGACFLVYRFRWRPRVPCCCVEFVGSRDPRADSDTTRSAAPLSQSIVVKIKGRPPSG